MIAYVEVGDGSWSIADIDDDAGGLMWWCGDQHQWVSPSSSHWHFSGSSCWNTVYPSLAAARKHARAMGFEQRGDDRREARA